jgi:CysZ protein
MRRVLSGFGFITGASYPLRFLALLREHPRLWGYLFTPIVINIIVGVFVYATLSWAGLQGLEQVIASLAQWLAQTIANLPSWLGFLEYLLLGLAWLVRMLLTLILFIIIGLIFVQFGCILGAPWYGKLSEQLEQICTNNIEVVEVGIIRDIGRAILFEIKKLLLVTAIGLPLLLANFLPGIGAVISSTGGLVLTGTIVCLDFFDAPLERRRFTFRKKLGIIIKSLPASAGFSLVCLGLIAVPLLNLITIPLCVGSGTLFMCDRILPKLGSGS